MVIKWSQRRLLMEISNKILIVDDDPVNVDIMMEILAAEYSCTAVYTGEEALKAEAAFKPDLILLDIMMPGIDGYEVCRQIRKKETDRFTKIILVSGKSMTEDRLKGYGAGADDYITKPFNDDELLAKVRVFLKMKRLEEVDAVKRNIINIFSHETRTPLSSIAGPAELLIENENLDEESRELAELILAGAKRIAELVNKTTLFSKLKYTGQIRTIQNCANESIRNAAALNAESAAAKNITIIVEETDIDVKADKDRLTDALNMLIENAVTFSPANSEIIVKVYISTPYAVFSVADKGKGISDEHKYTVFKSFYTGTPNSFEKGMGLGLAIVKLIAELHGGYADVTDTDGGGATFRLFIPLYGT
jgi:signal transduction histidine kinase